MDITFYCIRCGQRVVIEEAGAGLQVECPKCGQNLLVPKAAGFTARSFTKESLPPTVSTDSPPMIPQSIPPIPVRRRMSRRQIAVLVTACALAYVGLIALFTGRTDKTDEQDHAREKAASRILTAQYLKGAGGFLGVGSTWMVESAENNDGTKAPSGYMIYVWPSPHAAFKGDGLVTGDRLTFRAVFNGYEHLERADGGTIRVESWRPIE